MDKNLEESKKDETWDAKQVDKQDDRSSWQIPERFKSDLIAAESKLKDSAYKSEMLKDVKLDDTKEDDGDKDVTPNVTHHDQPQVQDNIISQAQASDNQVDHATSGNDDNQDTGDVGGDDG